MQVDATRREGQLLDACWDRQQCNCEARAEDVSKATQSPNTSKEVLKELELLTRANAKLTTDLGRQGTHLKAAASRVQQEMQRLQTLQVRRSERMVLL